MFIDTGTYPEAPKDRSRFTADSDVSYGTCLFPAPPKKHHLKDRSTLRKVAWPGVAPLASGALWPSGWPGAALDGCCLFAVALDGCFLLAGGESNYL